MQVHRHHERIRYITSRSDVAGLYARYLRARYVSYATAIRQKRVFANFIATAGNLLYKCFVKLPLNRSVK